MEKSSRDKGEAQYIEIGQGRKINWFLTLKMDRDFELHKGVRTRGLKGGTKIPRRESFVGNFMMKHNQEGQ